ncbi:MAG TPA: ATP-dependent Clp protease proteolytic subunit [Candidatus Paceibacterota bacterium]
MTSDQKSLLAKNRLVLGDNINRDTFFYFRESIFQKILEGSPRLLIMISSNGGETSAGLDICDLLTYYPGHKTATIHGVAASMAAVILQTCDWRSATTHSRVLIHHISVSKITIDTIRDAEKMKKFSGGMEREQAKLYQILMGRSGRTLEEIRATCELDSPMTAQEALQYGLLDQIITKETEIKFPEEEKKS